jgi:CheY-like chemotaxis protein
MHQDAPLVLYVEDDPNSRIVMNLMITRVLGAKLEIFNDTENFMERLCALPILPRVIFLDIYIAPLDGYAVLALLKNNVEYQDIPVIAMTASVTSMDLKDIEAAGYDGLIGKPIKGRIFPDLFKQILAGQPVWFIS